MAFRLRVIAVEYDSFGETVLTGVLEAGQIAGGDAIRVPTANGASFQSVVASMEGPGPEPPPFHAEKVGNAPLIVGVAGTPPKKDIVVPCVAEGSSTSHVLEALREIVGDAPPGRGVGAPPGRDAAPGQRLRRSAPAPDPAGAVTC